MSLIVQSLPLCMVKPGLYFSQYRIPFEPIQNIKHRVTDIFISLILILASMILNNIKLRTYLIVRVRNILI